MPQATQAGWLKTLGRLPWWRQPAYAKANGNGDPRLPVPAKGGQFAPNDGEEAESAQATKSRLRDWQMTGHPVMVEEYYVGGLGGQLGLKGRVAARFDLDVAALWKAHDAAKDIEKISDRYKAISIAVGLAKGLVDTYPSTLSFVATDVSALHRAVALRSQQASRESELGAIHWLLRRLSGGDLSRASERYAAQGPHIWTAMADLHPSRTEWAAILRSILADHPDWTRAHVLREARRRRGVLGAEARRRSHAAPKAVGDGDKTARAKAGVPPNTSADDGPDLAPLLQHASYAAVELNREPTRYEKKVDFAAIDRELTALAKQGRERVRAVLAGARDRLLALVGRKHKDSALTTAFVNGLELRGTGQLVPTLREMLRTAFQHGQQQADAELYRGRLGLAAPTAVSRARVARTLTQLHGRHPDWPKARLVEETRTAVTNGDGKAYQVKLVPEGLPPQKALEFFEQKATLWGADIRDPLLSDAKNALYNAIKTGQPLRDTLAALEAVFLPWLGDEDQQVDEKTVSPYRLETLVRTNATEAFNEGRKAQFQDEVDSGFIIGYQYSAILDERTTPVCRFLDGKILPPDSPETDQLSPPRHYNCFINPTVKFYTSKGWKTWTALRVGDRVLTHKGRFRTVTEKMVQPAEHVEVVRVWLAADQPRGGKSFKTFCVTPEHPVLANDQWTFAGKLRRGDLLAMLARPCTECGKPAPWFRQHCSWRCSGKHTLTGAVKRVLSADLRRQYVDGRRDRFQTTKGANRATRRLVKQGRWVLQDPEVRKLGMIAQTKRNYGMTWLESRLGWALTQAGLKPVKQLAIPRDGLTKQGHPRYVFPDFAFPKQKVAVEADGWRHRTEEGVAADKRRDAELTALGWTVLRFPEAAIKADLLACASQVSRVLTNHDGDYTNLPVKVAKVERYFVYAPRYNFAVEEDESYVGPAGIMMHNCRSLLSPVLRTEGPVEYVTPQEVAEGRELSGAGFAEVQRARTEELASAETG